MLVGLAPVVFTACATPPVSQRPLDEYPYRHEAFDLKVAWKTAPTPLGTRVEGMLQNVRYLQIRDVEVTVLLLDPTKRELAKSRSFTAPNYIYQDERASFDLSLPNVAPRKGDLLQFIINYYAVEDNENSLVWVTSFTVDALTGVQVGSY
jgi:hypothetical protein